MHNRNMKVSSMCNLCDQQFTQQSHLKTHIEYQHEGVKFHYSFKFDCNQCEYQATRQDNLRTHIKRKHL